MPHSTDLTLPVATTQTDSFPQTEKKGKPGRQGSEES